MSISNLPDWTKYGLLLALTWGLSLFAAEGSFRLLGDKPSQDMERLFAPFKENGYKLAPEVNTDADWASGRFSVYTDGLGLRCDLRHELATRPGDKLDVLFIGDSQGVGNGVNFEETIAGSVATQARADGYRVANASVGGHTLRQQLELAEWLYKGQQVKVSEYVLLLTPVLIVGANGYTHVTVGSDGRLYDKPKSRPEVALLYIKTHAVIYSRIRNAIRGAGVGVAPGGANTFLFGVFGSITNATDVVTNLGDCVQHFKELAAQQGARLSLVYVPLAVETDFEKLRQAGAHEGIQMDRDMPLRACSAVAEKLNLPLQNLRGVLEDFAKRGEPLHLVGDYHYRGDVSKACGASLWWNIRASLPQDKI